MKSKRSSGNQPALPVSCEGHKHLLGANKQGFELPVAPIKTIMALIYVADSVPVPAICEARSDQFLGVIGH